jgi:putative membrane protein
VRAPTEPQIAAIVVTTNQVDIDAGKLAKSGAQSPDVQAFAQRMITDPSAVNKSATDRQRPLRIRAGAAARDGQWVTNARSMT